MPLPPLFFYRQSFGSRGRGSGFSMETCRWENFRFEMKAACVDLNFTLPGKKQPAIDRQESRMPCALTARGKKGTIKRKNKDILSDLGDLCSGDSAGRG